MGLASTMMAVLRLGKCGICFLTHLVNWSARQTGVLGWLDWFDSFVI